MSLGTPEARGRCSLSKAERNLAGWGFGPVSSDSSGTKFQTLDGTSMKWAKAP